MTEEDIRQIFNLVDIDKSGAVTKRVNIVMMILIINTTTIIIIIIVDKSGGVTKRVNNARISQNDDGIIVTTRVNEHHH